MLIQLIERFQPERLAVIHAPSRISVCHRCREGQETDCGGEGPGIFVDPRVIDAGSGRVTNRRQMQEDKALAGKMITEALDQLERTPLPTTFDGEAPFPPFAGSQACRSNGVLYYSPPRTEGNSLGDWAPIATPGRAGITTITIEIPKYRTSESQSRVVDLHRDVLTDVFLGD